MKGDVNQLYSSARDFYALEGNFVMFLTPEAAAEVCCGAAKRGLVVGRIEGGIWHSPGFESRIDCIWTGLWPKLPISHDEAQENNLRGAAFIEGMKSDHSAFILTVKDLGDLNGTDLKEGGGN